MHILVTNDDGPPSPHSSPYISSLVSALHAAGHTTLVILPHTQCSWIGKSINAHGLVTTRTARFPEDIFSPDSREHGDEWVLVEGTPATCTQIGLGFYAPGSGKGTAGSEDVRGKGDGFDLVLSGPNFGRNSTAVFALSSGTLGAALEGAVCGKKSIALSYAFFSPDHNPTHIREASEASVRIIEHLVSNWDPQTHVYTINVPLGSPSLSTPGTSKVSFVPILQNLWTAGSSFTELPRAVSSAVSESADRREEELREAEQEAEIGAGGSGVKPHCSGEEENVRRFRWKPDFKAVYKSVEDAGEGSDGWIVQRGGISVSAIRANFMQVEGGGGVDFVV